MIFCGKLVATLTKCYLCLGIANECDAERREVNDGHFGIYDSSGGNFYDPLGEVESGCTGIM